MRTCGANWCCSIVKGGMQDADRTFRGLLILMRMKTWQIVLGAFWTRCMLYSMHAVLDICCTRRALTIMTGRDKEGWLNCVFWDDGRVVDEKQRDEGWRWEFCGGCEQLWGTRGTTSLIRLGKPYILGRIMHRIATCTSPIGDHKLTPNQNSLISQVVVITWPLSSQLCLSRPQLHYHLRTQV